MKIDWKVCFRVGLSAFLLYLCIHYLDPAYQLLMTILGAASPLILGGILAYLVNILMCFYEKHYFPKSAKPLAKKSKRPVCLTLAFLTLVAIVVLVFSLVIPQLVSCVQLIFAGLQSTVNLLVNKFENTEIIPKDIIERLTQIDWQSHIGKILESFSTGVGNVLNILATTITYVFSAVVSVLLSIIFAVYLLISKDTLKGQLQKIMNRYLKPSVNKKIRHLAFVVNDCFHDYIVGQCIEAVILGGLCTIGMLILQLPYATTIGALVAFTALIPIAGAYIGAFVGAFILLTVSPMKALVFVIFLIILQQVEGNIIYPKVVGKSLGLPALWVLAAVTIGGGIMGVPGMLLGVPLAATVYRLVKEDVNKPSITPPQVEPDTPVNNEATKD